MRSIPDPRVRLRRQTSGAVAILVVLAAGALWWAVDLPAYAQPRDATVPEAPVLAGSAIDPVLWSTPWWRPFTDRPPASAGPTAPAVPAKLFSILRQPEGLVAVIDPGGDRGLLYLKAGEASAGISVVGVTPTSAELVVNGVPQTVEMGR